MKREFTASQLADLFGGKLVLTTSPAPAVEVGERSEPGGSSHGSSVITGFATDSRAAKPGDLFIAIHGANVDGRDYLDRTQASCALVEKGPRHRFVENPPISVIVVDDVVEALARFGRTLRAEFKGPVVGVTGSVGKSTAKEFIAAALAPLGEVVKTEGNRNTEYTAPLLWAEVGPETKAVVVEMGMRGLGQIAHLASIAQPTIGVVTNIGVTHLSELGSVENIARAKAELIDGLSAGSTAVVWSDDPWLELLKSKAAGIGARFVTFGESGGADFRFSDYEATDWSSSAASVNGHPISLPVVGRHFGLAAAPAMAAAEAAGVPLEAAAEALTKVELPPMRMAVREREGITWVLDMYNAAPASTIAALETVADVADGPKFAILGEMRELGEATESGHREVGAALARLGFSAAITLDAGAPESSDPGTRDPEPGTRLPTAQIIQAAIEAGMPESNLTHAASFEEVRAWLRDRQAGDTILVKGSRGVELERTIPEGIIAS